MKNQKIALAMLPYPYVNSSSFLHYFSDELEKFIQKLPKIYMLFKKWIW